MMCTRRQTSLFPSHWDIWLKNVHFGAVMNDYYSWVGGTHRYPMGGKNSTSVGIDFDFRPIFDYS